VVARAAVEQAPAVDSSLLAWRYLEDAEVLKLRTGFVAATSRNPSQGALAESTGRKDFGQGRVANGIEGAGQRGLSKLEAKASARSGSGWAN